MARPKKENTEPKQSNLSLSTVKKVSKKLDQTQVHVIQSGEYIGEQITFYPLFNDVAIEELLTDFSKLMNEADKKDIIITQNVQLYLIYILIVKHFTHFKSDIPSHLLSEEKQAGVLDILEHFRKTGLLKECMDNMFLPQETSKVLNRMTDIAATGLLAMNLNDQMVNKLEELREQNSDAFKKIDEIKIENNIVE